MIGTFDINFEKQHIKSDAEKTFKNLVYRADSRQLEIRLPQSHWL